jgi:hypothetical protein
MSSKHERNGYKMNLKIKFGTVLLDDFVFSVNLYHFMNGYINTA